MSLMRYIIPTLDETFMLALAWVDRTYLAKHLPGSATNPGMAVPPEMTSRLYHPTLALYKPHKDSVPPAESDPKKALKPKTLKKNSPLKKFLFRSARKAGISLGIYIATFIPYLGPLVLPASSIYSLQSVTGPLPAAVFAFAALFIFPKSLTVKILQTYFASRSLVRDLLEPYFSRLPFTSQQKRRWFLDREGLLLGFGIGWVLLVKIPLAGVLVYGIAEASTAYLITKITEPVPPPPSSSVSVPNEKGGFGRRSGTGRDVDGEEVLKEWCETQTQWKNKQKFLSLPTEFWDKFTAGGGVDGDAGGGRGTGTGTGFGAMPSTPVRREDEMRYRRQYPGEYMSPTDRPREGVASGGSTYEGQFTGGRI